MLIGISGYAQAGKDSIGEFLESKYGFKRIAFADSLKRLALAIDPEMQGSFTLKYLFGLCDGDWEKAKRYPQVRRFLQNLGVGCREVIDTDFWIKIVESQLSGDTVITDVRFLNEAEMIARKGGLLWRVERPGFGPVNGHKSETMLDGHDFDARFSNDGSLEDLYARVDAYFKEVS